MKKVVLIFLPILLLVLSSCKKDLLKAGGMQNEFLQNVTGKGLSNPDADYLFSLMTRNNYLWDKERGLSQLNYHYSMVKGGAKESKYQDMGKVTFGDVDIPTHIRDGRVTGYSTQVDESLRRFFPSTTALSIPTIGVNLECKTAKPIEIKSFSNVGIATWESSPEEDYIILIASNLNDESDYACQLIPDNGQLNLSQYLKPYNQDGRYELTLFRGNILSVKCSNDKVLNFYYYSEVFLRT